MINVINVYTVKVRIVIGWGLILNHANGVCNRLMHKFLCVSLITLIFIHKNLTLTKKIHSTYNYISDKNISIGMSLYYTSAMMLDIVLQSDYNTNHKIYNLHQKGLSRVVPVCSFVSRFNKNKQFPVS